MSQADHVLYHLITRGEITALEAFRHYGIMQMPRRVFDLRRRGYPVETRMVTRKNRYGEKVRIAVYSLARERVA